jgi:hypothetical protein
MSGQFVVIFYECIDNRNSFEIYGPYNEKYIKENTAFILNKNNSFGNHSESSIEEFRNYFELSIHDTLDKRDVIIVKAVELEV